MTFTDNSPAPQWMNPFDFNDLSTFPLLPHSGQTLHFLSGSTCNVLRDVINSLVKVLFLNVLSDQQFKPQIYCVYDDTKQIEAYFHK